MYAATPNAVGTVVVIIYEFLTEMLISLSTVNAWAAIRCHVASKVLIVNLTYQN